MKMILVTVMLSLIMVTGISACSAPSSMSEDTEWFLRSYGEQNNLHAVIEGTEVTATFYGADGKIGGSAGCNGYSASYKVLGNRLFIGGISVTAMMCVSPEGIMEQEDEYLAMLASAQSFQADETALTVFCSGGQQLYFTTATNIQ